MSLTNGKDVLWQTSQMNDLILNIAVIALVLTWVVYWMVILPKLREYRTIYLGDWGLWPHRPINNLYEYKSICEKEGIPITWFKIQFYLILSVIFLFLLAALVV